MFQILIKGVQRLKELHCSTQLFVLSVFKEDGSCQVDLHEQTIHKKVLMMKRLRHLDAKSRNQQWSLLQYLTRLNYYCQ
ncbi:hypothetical protein evm_013948 [Chilo suppressalis]|nr:hypothetical protein evm_013948 [Chilo suppressalis]